MILSDISITRPVFASVLSLLLIAFGLVAYDRLPLREYPDIDPPVVSTETTGGSKTVSPNSSRTAFPASKASASSSPRVRTAAR